ncbi:MAG TPA: hypothetical protein VFT93_05360 [Candidatus Eisenbacteria bacterium]|nr:hypothetical protein [Candidatus Eisenbacteria bacterium]
MNPVTQNWIAAFLTLCVFSFLYRDNPFYRFAEHLFVGAAAGDLLAVQYQNVIKPNVIGEMNQGNMLPLVPLALGIILLGRLWPRTSGIARWSLAFYVGIYSGIAIPSYLQAQIFAQLADQVKPFAPGWGAVNSALILIGFITVLSYFFFSAAHRGLHGLSARIGIWFLMVAFGASFGYTVMARVSLLIARMQFLLRDWLHLLPPA